MTGRNVYKIRTGGDRVTTDRALLDYSRFGDRGYINPADISSGGGEEGYVGFEDDFERPDGSLGDNWSPPLSSEGPVTIIGGQARASIPGAICSAYWSANDFEDDQFSEVTLGEITDNLGVSVRAGGSDRLYKAVVYGGSVTRIYQRWDGAWILLTDGYTTWSTGDKLKITIEGSIHPFVVRVYRNDELIMEWTSTGPEQEKTGGHPGIGFSGLNSSIDSWKGGNL